MNALARERKSKEWAVFFLRCSLDRSKSITTKATLAEGSAAIGRGHR
ncbi:hypothetical protein AZ78_0636 [Lysobacter capsici AZ78]|uniref:Uncharacterized protein n=1 Tax=Lysobacter capsici AZ78 TaxID=1444315 RepID=A0A108U5T1_9GAMM|nr:hypothetical protein AZ78_0636 [Lysobacter capsici AZ78]